MSTLNIRRITSSSDALYSGCVRIYEESFPYEERRDTAVMTGMLSDDRFHFIVFYGDREEDGPVGFFTFWDFGHGYLYGEHFAVDPSRRGGGTGTRVLDYIKSLGIPMILEIEMPSEEDEAQRLHPQSPRPHPAGLSSRLASRSDARDDLALRLLPRRVRTVPHRPTRNHAGAVAA